MNRMHFLLAWAFALLISMGPAEASPLLRDGLYAKAVEGRVVAISDKGPWLFQIQSDIKDQNIVVPGGTRLELLPCAKLEQLLDDAKVAAHTDIRICAKITQYKGKNYLFLTDYLRLGQPLVQPVPDQPAEADAPAKVNRLQIPEAIKIQRVQHRVVYPPSLPRDANVLANRILINRFGYVETDRDQRVFVFDGLGFSEKDPPVRVLPCQVLERIEHVQNSGVGPYRFSIAGLTTTFRGQQYIALQRAFRVFNHGNFGQ
ncbi:MAG: hypothetical protein K9N55_15045 [Phycisphaerae bacterium]|nr:hypothetical protein [Phycisphaerae bacterium]